jgi:hypothetical protein
VAGDSTESGGEVVEWPEEVSELVVSGFLYRRVSETQAVFVGSA